MKKCSNTSEVLKARNTPFTRFVLLLSMFFFLPSVLMPYIWYDLREVTIISGSTPQEIKMIVDREIISNFSGSFTVSVVNSNNEFICKSAPPVAYDYKEGNNLPEPLYLSWWLGGADRMKACIDAGFGTGTYTIKTCHTVLFTHWKIRLAERCVLSNEFYVA